MVILGIIKPKMLAFVPLILLLAIAVACGEEATPTSPPAATPTTAPATPTPVPPAATPLPEATQTPTAMAKGDGMAKATPTPTPTPVPVTRPTPTPTPVITPTPRPKGILTSTSPQLIVSIIPAGDTYVVHKILCCAGLFQDKRPIYEWLIDNDHKTAQYYPMLTTGWQMSADARTWTFDLREDVPWHFGYGEFTAADVVHTWELYTGEDSIALYASTFKAMLETRDNLEVVNDHQIIWNLVRPEPDLVYHVSTRENAFVMVNKAQWDEGGEEGWDRQPSGTGSYQFVSRKLGESALYERVENHWRKTPEFKELLYRFVHEDAVRLAMSLTGEAHIVTLPSDLADQALARGKALIQGFTPPTAVTYAFGGLYFSNPELIDPDVKWLDVRVREAMNRAINRHEIIDTIFAGRGEIAHLQYWHKTQQGWNPKWEEDFESLYGYDVEKSKALLAEAGYPDGFSTTFRNCSQGSFPQLQQLDEALGVYLKEVGITITIEELPCGTFFRQMKDRDLQGLIFGFVPYSMGPPALRSVLIYRSGIEGYADGYNEPCQ